MAEAFVVAARPAGADRPVPGRRHRSRRRRHQRRPATSSSPASWSTSKRPASTRATRPARFRRTACTGPILQEIREATHGLAKHMRVVGLMNIQFAIKNEDGRQVLYVLEVNPRASRTVPFVAKATGMPVAKSRGQSHGRHVAGRAGRATASRFPAHVSVKESVFPVRQVRRRRYRARARDALDRRSDGRQRAVLDRLCQEPARRRHRAADARAAFSSASRRAAQRTHGRPGRAAGRDWAIKLLATDGHGRRLGRGRHPGAST